VATVSSAGVLRAISAGDATCARRITFFNLQLPYARESSREREAVCYLHNVPGQIQHFTPPWLEQVPDRFWEQLSQPSAQTAVAAPQDA
jgi:hypothetical protein